MFLIIGLGNPGKEYASTRHNVGFMFVDSFAKENNFPEFHIESKFKGEITQGAVAGEKVLLLKPTTYMNLSGESIKKVIDFYKIEKNNWIVIFDDFSMELGKIRYREEGSSGGHNGIKSIISYFGEEFHRIKLGIGRNERYEISDWVLSRFNKTELQEINSTFLPKIGEIVEKFIKKISLKSL